MFNKILAAIDGSEISKKVLKVTFNLAKKVFGEVILVSVVDHKFLPFFSYPTTPIPTNRKLTIKLLKSSRRFYRKLLDKTLKQRGELNPRVKISTKLMEGNPSVEIVRVAKDKKVDLIIVGNKSHSSIRKFFLGSVSDNIISKSNIPVLVVK